MKTRAARRSRRIASIAQLARAEGMRPGCSSVPSSIRDVSERLTVDCLLDSGHELLRAHLAGDERSRILLGYGRRLGTEQRLEPEHRVLGRGQLGHDELRRRREI